MIKKVVLFALLLSSVFVHAQKPQRFGYIDMEYILESLPEYTEANAKINAKAVSWKKNIDKNQDEIDDLKAELRNEKALLTKELIEEREEDIQIKELELKKLQAAYFGTNGDLFFLRKQLVEPIQDLIYNAIQEIAVNRKYDFVLDKSTDLIMLYTNKQYDISDQVITSIKRIKKVENANARRDKNQKNAAASPTKEVSEEAQKKLDDRATKKAEMQKRIEEKRAEQLKKREELLKANEAKKQQRIKEIEEAKKAKENKNN